MHVCLCVYSSLFELVRMTWSLKMRTLITNTYIYIQMRVRGALRWESIRGLLERQSSASNHMSAKGGSSGSRPGVGGNQQHMNHIWGRGKGDEGAKRGVQGKAGFQPKLSKHWHHTLWSGYQTKHRELQDMFLNPKTTPHDHSAVGLCRSVFSSYMSW